MHFDPEWLNALTWDELDDVHNWCRCREKENRRLGNHALAAFWRSMGSAILVETNRRNTELYFHAHEGQLALFSSPKASPELRQLRGTVQ